MGAGHSPVATTEVLCFATTGRDVAGLLFFFFKQKTAYEIGWCDWSSDVCSSDLPGLEMQVAGTGGGRRRCIALRVPGGDKAKLAGGRAVQQPRTQNAVFDECKLFSGDAFAVERMRAQPAFAQRVVDNANPVGEQLRLHLVSQEAGLARDRCAIDGAGQMRNQRAGGARIEHDRHLTCADLAWAE